MSLEGELGVEISKIRKVLLGLMSDARTIKDNIRAALEDGARVELALKTAGHDQTSLKTAISVALDSLDAIDQRLRAPPAE